MSLISTVKRGLGDDYYDDVDDDDVGDDDDFWKMQMLPN